MCSIFIVYKICSENVAKVLICFELFGLFHNLFCNGANKVSFCLHVHVALQDGPTHCTVIVGLSLVSLYLVFDRARRRGIHEPVTARDEVGVTVTVIEVAPVPVTAGDVATVPVTAGDVERRAPAERPRRTLHRARGERRREARACYVRRSVRTRGRGRGEMLKAWKG